MKKFKFILLTVITGVIFSLVPTISFAEETPGVGYEIRPLLPNTQIDNDRGYYYVQTEPGKKQTLSLSIFNTSDEDKTIQVSLEDAISTDVGTIGYSDDPEKRHESLINSITEIVKTPEKEITLKPKEEGIVDFELTPPNEHYDGVKIGRVVVKEKTPEDEKGISQEYQYALGIITSESGVNYNDGKTLGIEKAQANINFGTKAIEAYLFNPEPKTIEDLKVRSYVTKKGETKKIKERNVDNFAFAPNSKVTYTIPWGLSDFQSGEYTFHFKAENQYETFDIEQDFTIRADDAKRLNKETAFGITTPYFIIYIIIGINTVLVVLFVVILTRDRKWVKELKEKKKSRKGKKKREKK